MGSGELLLILVCIILSGVFSGSETALTSLHEARIHQLLEVHRPGARLLRLWKTSPNLVLVTLLLWNNFVNILASSLATDFTLRLLKGTGLGSTGYAISIAVGVMTLLILTFGEIIPKTYAKNNCEQVVVLLPLLLLFHYVSLPLARLFSRFTASLVQLAGGSIQRRFPSVTADELEYFIEQLSHEGTLDRDTKFMLLAVFKLGEKVAKEIMTPRTEMIMLEANATLQQVLTIVEKQEFSRYPVYEEAKDEIIGLFYLKDLTRYLKKVDRPPFCVKDFLRTAYFVPETKPLDELLREFRRKRIHMAIVVDEWGGTAGLVTLEDVIEEMVGEIYDEYDEEKQLFKKLDKNRYSIEARIDLEDLAACLGEDLNREVELPESKDYESLGGLLMFVAGKVPETGEELTYTLPPPDASDESEPTKPLILRFKILDSDGRRIGRVELFIEEGPTEQPVEA